nr:hypothetical protein [uncultured Ottowia sp.]
MTDEQIVRRIEALNFRIFALMSLCESQPERREEHQAQVIRLARDVAMLVTQLQPDTVAAMGWAGADSATRKETV